MPTDIQSVRVKVYYDFSGGGGGSAPVNTDLPDISGSTLEGTTLVKTSDGSWDNSPTSYTYQWMRETTPGSGVFTSAISGATGTTYIVRPTDVSYSFKCEVTATNGSGSTPALSNAIGPIVASGKISEIDLSRFPIPQLRRS